MLDLHDDGRNGDGCMQLAHVVERLPCKIRLPESWDGFFSVGVQPLPVHPDTTRQHQRISLRIKAALLHRQTLPSLPREKQWNQVYVVNASLGGLLFYHSQQLFPRERMRMLLPSSTVERLMPNRVNCIVEVTRCRRIQECCHEIGARFVESFREAAQAKPPVVARR